MKQLLTLFILATSFLSIEVYSQCDDYAGIEFMDVPVESCASCISIPFVLTTTGQGGIANDLYFVEMSASDGTVGSAFWTDGTGSGDICLEIPGCDPVPIDLLFGVYCDDGTLLESKALTVTFYPQLVLEYGELSCLDFGGAPVASVINSFTGERCTEIVEGKAYTSLVCGEDNITSIFYSFPFYEETPCYQVFENDLSLECCCPIPISYPTSLCPGLNEFCVEFDSELGDRIGYFFSTTPNGVTVSEPTSVVGNTMCFDVEVNNSAFDNNGCSPQEINIGLDMSCLIISIPILANLTGITINPDLSNIAVSVIPASCGETPQVIPACGIAIIDNVIPPVNDPDAPVNGSADYAIELGFDFAATGCYNDVPALMGSVVIPACLEPTAGCPDAFNGTLQIKAVKKKD